ncbi:ABC transporter substrate-binding protein [Nonomuraea longispora]|uniref:ABC transporter substrate-binding protein n=1 Tax=Nonomuraea longispora TaxID=1848320 RepID=A0A4R4NQY9_9ACTN|nr:ABC transporter substrate-binding protein [Nonomuraea longispora]
MGDKAPPETRVPLTRRGLFAGAATLAVSACGGGRSSAPMNTAGPTGPPRRGGTLRLPLTAEPIAPAFDMGTSAAGSVGTAAIATLAYNGLVEVSDGKVVPQLAEAWDRASPTRYVFDLRRDVVFHDGTPFDAAAVKANFDRLLDPEGDGVNLPPFLESVKVLGRHQVEMRLSRPAASFLPSLRRGRVMMMSPVAVAKFAKSDPFRASVGTGPYVFKEYRAGNVIRLERNDDYWGDDNYLDAITFTIIPDTNTQIMAFLNDEFDMIDVLPGKASQVKRRRDAVWRENTGNTFNYLTFNQTVKPFDNADVRRGFSAALDREGIAAGIYGGHAKAAHGPFSPAIGPAFEDLSGGAAQAYSVDEAKKFLARAGYDFGAEVAFNAFTQSPWAQEADAMAAQLEQVGVNVRLNKEDFGSWADRIYTSRDFALTNSGQTTRTVDPDEVIYPLVHSKGDLNVSGVDDPELDDLLEKARAEDDPGLRAEMYHDVARLVADNAYAAFTVWPSTLTAMSPKVGGYAFSPGGTHGAAQCWLSA